MRTTKLNQITLCADGSIGLQLLKVISDGDTVISSEPHRINIMPDQTSGDIVSALEPHLALLGFGMITGEELKHIDKVAKSHRTLPSVAEGVAAYAKARAKAIAQAEAEAKAAKEAREEEAKQAEAGLTGQEKAIAKFVADEVARQLAGGKQQ